MNFADRLQGAIARNKSLLIVGLDPNPEMLPQNHGDSLEDLWKGLEDTIHQTADLVCAYKPTLGFYTTLGAAGMELLQRTLAAIPPEIPVILDAKHGDLNTATFFAKTAFREWNVDAITLTPYSGQDHVAPFLLYPDQAVFVLCHTSNPAAVALQEFPTPETPLYLQIVQEARSWGTPDQLALEVGTTRPEILARIRFLAPERTILVRSIWAENCNLNDILMAGLNTNGDGLLIPVPQDYLFQKNTKALVKQLRDSINETRVAIHREGLTCEVWMPEISQSKQHPYQDLIIKLYEMGCLLFGEYVQASGATFSYYIDLRQIISNPQIFNQILNAYADILRTLEFDRIAGIPYGSLPTATGLSLLLQHPMIYPRKEVKAHGTRRVVEGTFQAGETVVIVDDILISGKSALEGAGKLESVGLKVKDIVVLIDHEKGVKDRIKAAGYNAYSVLTISEISKTLYQTGRITEAQYQVILDDH